MENTITFASLEASLESATKFLDSTEKVSIFAAIESAVAELDQILGVSKPELVSLSALESTIDEGLGLFEEKEEEEKEDEQANESTLLDKLLTQVRTTVDVKCTTLEKCNEMAVSIATEATKFNDCMSTMADAGKQLKDNTISKTEFRDMIAPSVTELKAQCAIIGKIDPEFTLESAISDENISLIRSFIIETAKVVDEKMKAFESVTEADEEVDSFISLCDDMKIATEGKGKDDDDDEEDDDEDDDVLEQILNSL